jgi:hypothetical protein
VRADRSLAVEVVIGFHEAESWGWGSLQASWLATQGATSRGSNQCALRALNVAGAVYC